jgi:hypothetical protein
MSSTLTLATDFNNCACEDCGVVTEVIRFFFMSGDSSGYSPFLCPACLIKNSVRDVPMYVPEKESNQKPPTRQRRKTVQKHEREMATLIGGRTQKASGALASAKGDVRCKGVLRGEMKSTVKRSFTIKREILDKIRSECTGIEKPFVALRFMHPQTLAAEDDWVLIPLEHWEHGNHDPF